MAGLKPINDIGDLDQWRQQLEQVLPEEPILLRPPTGTRFEIVDDSTLRFLFDPRPEATAYDVEFGYDPDFRRAETRRLFFRTDENSRVRRESSLEVNVPILRPIDECALRMYFRARCVRNEQVGEWSAPAVFRTPTPGPLAGMTAGHVIDNPVEENTFINVNVTLPRTASIAGTVLADPLAYWTEFVEVEADWSTLAANLSDSATTMTVATGHGPYFKPAGYYKLKNGDDEEIVFVHGVAADVVTIERGC